MIDMNIGLVFVWSALAALSYEKGLWSIFGFACACLGFRLRMGVSEK